MNLAGTSSAEWNKSLNSWGVRDVWTPILVISFECPQIRSERHTVKIDSVHRRYSIYICWSFTILSTARLSGYRFCACIDMDGKDNADLVSDATTLRVLLTCKQGCTFTDGDVVICTGNNSVDTILSTQRCSREVLSRSEQTRDIHGYTHLVVSIQDF